MVTDDGKKQDREQERTDHRDRIKDAVADFFAHGRKQVQARLARQGARQESLFETQEQGT